MQDTIETKLSGHLKTAVNAIQKEIDKKHSQLLKLNAKVQAAETEAESLREEIAGLKEQQSKLKGE